MCSNGNWLDHVELLERLDSGETRPGDWERFALCCAREANEENFESRRGIYPVQGGFLVVYNNHPYAKYPALRDEETAKLRVKLKGMGLEELGYATYPLPGPDVDLPGYSYAMVIRAEEERMDEVRKAAEQILRESIEWMDKNDPLVTAG